MSVDPAASRVESRKSKVEHGALSVFRSLAIVRAALQRHVQVLMGLSTAIIDHAPTCHSSCEASASRSAGHHAGALVLAAITRSSLRDGGSARSSRIRGCGFAATPGYRRSSLRDVRMHLRHPRTRTQRSGSRTRTRSRTRSNCRSCTSRNIPSIERLRK